MNTAIDEMVKQSKLEFVNGTYLISVYQMQNMPYDLYLQTEHWQHFSSEALKFSRYRCQLCDKNNVEINVHHKNYENIGRETFNDVIVLCKNCHEKHHERSEVE
jgi:hypothetical protein